MADINNPEQQNSNLPSAHDNATRVFPLYLLLFVAVPVLPFFFSMATLSFVIHPSLDSKEILVIARQLLADNSIIFIDQPVKILTHLSDLLTYLSIASVHVIACLVVIGFFFYQIHQFPGALIRHTYLYMAATMVTLVIIAYVIHMYADNLMLIQLGYKSTCVLMGMADLQTSLVWPDSDVDSGSTGEACFRPELTKLVWLAYTPVLFGVLAMISASAFTAIMASTPMPSVDEQWRPNFLVRVSILQKSFYLLSLVLVTSTVTIMLFTSLPLELLAETEDSGALKTAFKKFIIGITAFWGGLFTATLFAVFVPAAILLIRHTLHHLKRETIPSNLGEWLHESVFVSIKKQAINASMMIAPMLVGPLGSLLQKLSGLTG